SHHFAPGSLSISFLLVGAQLASSARKWKHLATRALAEILSARVGPDSGQYFAAFRREAEKNRSQFPARSHQPHHNGRTTRCFPKPVGAAFHAYLRKDRGWQICPRRPPGIEIQEEN